LTDALDRVARRLTPNFGSVSRAIVQADPNIVHSLTMAASGALGRREKEIDQWVRWKNRKEVKALFLDEYANAVLLGLVLGLELAAVEGYEIEETGAGFRLVNVHHKTNEKGVLH